MSLSQETINDLTPRLAKQADIACMLKTLFDMLGRNQDNARTAKDLWDDLIVVAEQLEQGSHAISEELQRRTKGGLQ